MLDVKIIDETAHIYVDGQDVLQIDEVSDNETINLFLIPVGDKCSIIETICKECDCQFTHELLVERLH